MSTRVEIPPCGTIGEGADPRRWLTLAVVLLADVDFRLQGRIAQRIERVVESAAVEVRERDFAASIERPLLRGRRVPAQLSAAEEGPRRLARAADHRGRTLMVRPASFMFGCTTPVYGEETLPTSFPGECLTSRQSLAAPTPGYPQFRFEVVQVLEDLGTPIRRESNLVLEGYRLSFCGARWVAYPPSTLSARPGEYTLLMRQRMNADRRSETTERRNGLEGSGRSCDRKIGC